MNVSRTSFSPKATTLKAAGAARGMAATGPGQCGEFAPPAAAASDGRKASPQTTAARSRGVLSVMARSDPSPTAIAILMLSAARSDHKASRFVRSDPPRLSGRRGSGVHVGRERVFLNEFAARLDHVAHQLGED